MITLVLAFHNHQPVGNFGWVFEQAYDCAYRPLMEVLDRHPRIRFAQHYTGILLDWFAEHHPDFLDRVRRDVHSGRLELLSGGYFEPILSMLPERDRIEQLERLNRRIAEEFDLPSRGPAPTGMWLAERVWEPSVPSTLARAGLEYTFLDDTHFKHAGLDASDLTGYFLTEDQGAKLAVFPIDKRLRYTIPFEAPEVTFEYLHTLNRKGHDRLVVFADDGEKFGIWPETYASVYEKKWLERFCELLDANAGWVRTMLPRDVLREAAPAGRIYLPTASYAEMLHWALPTVRSWQNYEKLEELMKRQELDETYGQFVRGGFWRNFLVKYPEANAMQKKMLRVSERLESLRTKNDGAGDALERAARHLLAGQCNCPYWHGVFGGLYLANIRSAIYRELILAEAELDAIDSDEGLRLEVSDYDLDGFEEIIVENGEMALYVAPARGGSIFELDHKPTGHNFSDLLQRRREGYHALLLDRGRRTHEPQHDPDAKPRSIHESFKVKEAGLERLLACEPYRHAILVDHFYGSDISVEALRAGTARDLGDFAMGRFEFAIEDGDNGRSLRLSRAGEVDSHRVVVEKTIRVDPDRAIFDVEYVLTALDGPLPRLSFGLELSYSLSAGSEPDRYYEVDGVRASESRGTMAGVGDSRAGRFALVDEWLGARIDVELGHPARLLRTPVETVSLSEDGFERNYQGSLLVALWDIEAGTEWRISLRQSIARLR